MSFELVEAFFSDSMWARRTPGRRDVLRRMANFYGCPIYWEVISIYSYGEGVSLAKAIDEAWYKPSFELSLVRGLDLSQVVYEFAVVSGSKPSGEMRCGSVIYVGQKEYIPAKQLQQ